MGRSNQPTIGRRLASRSASGHSIVSYFFYAAPEQDPPDLAILADLVDAGRVALAVAATSPLAEAAAAVKALTARQVHEGSSSPPREVADRELL